MKGSFKNDDRICHLLFQQLNSENRILKEKSIDFKMDVISLRYGNQRT
jgi:hypothetical protein